MDLKLLRNKNFALFVFGQSSSIFGNIMLNIALSLYILKITGSAEKFAAILAIGIIPQIFFGPFAGIFIDRMDKKKTIIFLDFIRGLYLIYLLILLNYNALTVNMIYVTVIFFATCDIFFGPSFITILPSILEREELVSGNTLQNTIGEITKVAAPVLGTFLFGLYGLKIILIIDIITYFISTISEYYMDFISPINKENDQNFMGQLKDGFKVFVQDIRITSLVTNGILSHIFLLPFFLVGLPYMLIEIFQVPEIYYGIVQSTMPVAYLLAMALVSITKTKLDIGDSINLGIIGMLASVVVIMLLASSSFVNFLKNVPLFTLLYFVLITFMMFVSFGYYGVFFVSFYQSNVSKIYLGRFGAILIMLFSMGRFIGFRIYGYLFNQNLLIYPVIVLGIGMALKLVVHLPFLKKEKSKVNNIY